MKSAHALIRLADYQVETLRKRVAEIGARRVACEMILESLELEAATETKRAQGDAQVGWYLIGFREGWKLRKQKATADLAAVQLEEQGALDALQQAYEEMKKVEHVVEQAKIATTRAAAAKDAAAMDEMALRRARRS